MSDEPLAFAKLQGRNGTAEVVYYITALPAELGRTHSAKHGSSGLRIDLGDSKLLSRQHAKIDWNAQTKCFEITCLGKNGILVAGVVCNQNSVTPIKSKAPIKIGPVMLYFLLAKQSIKPISKSPSTPRVSYSELIQMAFEGHDRCRHGDGILTTKEIVEWVCSNVPGYHDDSHRKSTSQLSGGVRKELTRQPNFEKVGDTSGGVLGRYRMVSQVQGGAGGGPRKKQKIE